MSIPARTLTGVALSLSLMATPVIADNTGTVQAFYDLLSNPGSKESSDAFVAATADGWESVGDYSDSNKSRDAFLGQVGGFAKLIPDLNWAVQDMHEDVNFVTGRAFFWRGWRRPQL